MKVENIELSKEDMDYYLRIKWYDIKCDFCNKPTGATCTADDPTEGRAVICGDCYDKYIKRS